MVKRKAFEPNDYGRVCDFLIELNRDGREHINWNWARFEWMYEHPMFDKSLLSRIGLWIDDGKVVGVAIYDMFLGEASVLALPGYSALYPEILEYAYRNLGDDQGLRVAVPEGNERETRALLDAGYRETEQTETVMAIDLGAPLPDAKKEGMEFVHLDPIDDYGELAWMFWQGFDHGSDREECERENQDKGNPRVHYDPRLAVTVRWEGKYVGHCSLWYDTKTDYAYVEPVCVIPDYRGKGVAKAMIYEALNRARSLGAKKAYVISDMAFYGKLGFREAARYTFYQKKAGV